KHLRRPAAGWTACCKKDEPTVEKHGATNLGDEHTLTGYRARTKRAGAHRGSSMGRVSASGECRFREFGGPRALLFHRRWKPRHRQPTSKPCALSPARSALRAQPCALSPARSALRARPCALRWCCLGRHAEAPRHLELDEIDQRAYGWGHQRAARVDHPKTCGRWSRFWQHLDQLARGQAIFDEVARKEPQPEPATASLHRGEEAVDGYAPRHVDLGLSA